MILIALLVSPNLSFSLFLLVIALSVLLRCTTSIYPIVIVQPFFFSYFVLVIILSVLLSIPTSDYPLGIFKPFFGSCIVCPSLICGFWLPLEHLQLFFLYVFVWYIVLVLSVLLRITTSSYPFGIFKSFLLLLFLLLLFYFWVIVLSDHLWFPDSSYSFGIFKSFFLLFFFVVIVLSDHFLFPCSNYPFERERVDHVQTRYSLSDK